MCLPHSLKDIWSDDLVSCEGSDECSPQMPKVTHQFENTLRDNKGKPHKKDLMASLEAPFKEMISKDSLTINGKLKKFKTCSKSNPHCKRPKPSTYKSNSPRRKSKLLRDIPSCEILQLLISCKED
ncbi:unnamed protein product [Moneuplotes crassus]|uniref:Uncharacterized protein n=1 Tax=Euplotes crassus TaxID=5936 RepID=A0AAD1U2A5_EUPCR|nr:unnamed protein product [Moneuplotes crassus]